MSLRTSKYLIRAVLILLLFQFFAPAFILNLETAESSGLIKNANVYHKHKNQSTSLASLFEKTEKETEESERDKVLAVAIIDLAVSNKSRVSASQLITQRITISQHIQELPLFNLLCIYRI